MEFLKSATILRKFYEENKQSEYIFSETDFETVLYPNLYRAAAKLACYVGLSNLKDVEIAILGRWSSFTIQAFIASCMTGCPSLCIDIWEEHSFGHMTKTKPSVLFIDSQSLRSNLDLSKYKSVKLLVINGQSQFSIICDAERIMYCDEIDNISNSLEQVWEIESTSNVQKVLTYGSTSGSTGAPKLIVYKNAVSIALLEFDNDIQPTLTGIFKLFKHFGFWESMAFLKGMMEKKFALGLNFNGFSMMSVVFALNTIPGKSKYILMNLFEKNWLEIVESYKANILVAYNPKLVELVAQEDFFTRDFSSVYGIISGGSYLCPDIYKTIRLKFGKHTNSNYFPIIQNVYAASEMGGVCLKNGIFEHEDFRAKSIGKIPIHGYKAEIRSPEGKILEPHEIGEIWIFSAQRMINYHHLMHEPSIEWFATGDSGYVDENGSFFIIGRLKETITLRNAVKINATSIEELLVHQELIWEVAVVFEQNKLAYDDIHIFVSSPDPQLAEIFCKNQLPETYNAILYVQKNHLVKLSNGKYDKKMLLKNINRSESC